MAWWTTPSMSRFWENEQRLVRSVLCQQPGTVGLQLGAAWGCADVWDSSRFVLRGLVSPQPGGCSDLPQIQARWDELPLLPESVDLFWLPHTLEYAPSPQQLLTEVTAALVPGGRVIITLLNPWSPVGLNYRWARRRWACGGWLMSPWALRYQLYQHDLTVLQVYALYHNQVATAPLGYLSEWQAGGYLVLAVKQALGVTPLRLTWREPLAVDGRLYEPSTRQR